MDKKLHWRFEYKYLLSKFSATKLKEILSQSGFYPDPHAKDGHYHVSSIYFDSPGLDDYYDKAGGFIKRKKIRARIYEEHQSAKTLRIRIEVKLRKDLRVAKESMWLSIQEWELLRSGNYNKLLSIPRDTEHDLKTIKSVIGQIARDSMRPQLYVYYIRQPFVLSGDEIVRVSFDCKLQACQKTDFCYSPFTTTVLPDDQIILEIKFSSFIPSGLADVIKGFNLTRISYSKYAESVDAVRKFNPLPR